MANRDNILAVLAGSGLHDLAIDGDIYFGSVKQGDTTLPLVRVSDEALSGSADAWFGIAIVGGISAIYQRNAGGNWVANTT